MGHKFENVKHNLVSLLVLFNDHCEVSITKTRINVTKHGKQITTGYYKLATRLLQIKIEERKETIDKVTHAKIKNDGNGHCVNSIFPEVNMAELTEVCTKSAILPINTNTMKVIKNGNLDTRPMLTEDNVKNIS